MEAHVFCVKRDGKSKMTKHKRGHFRMISNILYFTRNGSLKTELMRKANLSYAQLKRYVPMLIRLKPICGIKEFFLGSVSDRVPEDAKCPVLIVK